MSTYELPTDDAVFAQDPAFEKWWTFFKDAQGLSDGSIRASMGVRVFARCAWLAAQNAKRRAPNCPVCGAAPLTLCAPGCTYTEQMNELAASTLEGLSEDEKRTVTTRPSDGNSCPRCATPYPEAVDYMADNPDGTESQTMRCATCGEEWTDIHPAAPPDTHEEE